MKDTETLRPSTFNNKTTTAKNNFCSERCKRTQKKLQKNPAHKDTIHPLKPSVMLPQNEMTDSDILAALRAGGSAREMAWEYMYKKWRGIWLHKIKDAGGNSDEAHEALNEVCMPFEKAVTAAGFQLKSARLNTYLVTCIFRRWVKNTGRKPRTEELEDSHLKNFAANVEDEIARRDCRGLLNTLLTRLGERCKKILTLWAEGYSGEEIADEMGFEGGAETAKKEKYKCTIKMEKYLQNHPDFKARLSDCYHHG